MFPLIFKSNMLKFNDSSAAPVGFSEVKQAAARHTTSQGSSSWFRNKKI